MRASPAAFLASLVTASVGLSATSAAAQDVEFPARKAGQWEIRMVPETPGAMPEMAIQACIDEASDKAMMEAGLSMSKSMCSHYEMRREGDAFVIDSTCQMGPMTTASRVVMSGDFQSAYTVRMTSETTGAMAAMAGTNTMIQEARWLGADCTDGMAPGDMLMPGGMKMNVNEMMKMMGGG